MGTLDWIVLGTYLCGMVALSFYLSRGQEDEADYYVGGRNLPWWAVGISTMATQTSANSFIGIPAFVALSVGGGLTWLYEGNLPIEDKPGIGGRVNGKYSNVSLYIFSLYWTWN